MRTEVSPPTDRCGDPLRVVRRDGASFSVEPGNGTRFDVSIVRHPYGGVTWTWAPGTAVIAAGWADERSFRVAIGKVSKGDRELLARYVVAAAAVLLGVS